MIRINDNKSRKKIKKKAFNEQIDGNVIEWGNEPTLKWMTVNNWKYYVPLNSLLIGYSCDFSSWLSSSVHLTLKSFHFIRYECTFIAVNAFAFQVFFRTASYLSVFIIHTGTEHYVYMVDFSSSYLISIVINNRSNQQNQNKEIINQLAFNSKWAIFFYSIVVDLIVPPDCRINCH